MSHAPQSLRDVILLVDASSSLSGICQSLINEYVLPCLEYFVGGSVRRPTSELQYGPVQFGLVTMNSPGVTYRQACTYYPVTCDAAQLVQWLKEMRFEGGLMEHSLHLSEGFAAVLEMCDLMSTTRELCLGPNQIVEQYCLLICNFPPSNQLCVESMKYGGKSHEQLSRIMVERNLQMSVIAPRNLLHFKKIFERGLVTLEAGNDTITDSDHSLHTGHIALFQGFSLEDLKNKREADLMKKAKENDSKLSTSLKYVHMEPQPSVTPFSHTTENTGQLLPASLDNKTPSAQSSPHGGVSNTSPSIGNQPLQKPVEMIPNSVIDDNPMSTITSVFSASSPCDPSSPQHPQVSTTLSSVSPPPSTAGTLPVSRVPPQMSVGPTLSHSRTLPLQVPASTVHQNVPVAHSFAQTTNQLGNQNVATSHVPLLPSGSHPPSSNPHSQGVTSLSLPHKIQLTSSVAQGFPNVVATCTSLPSTSNSTLYSQLGTSHSPVVSSSNQVRQPDSSMAAAVAAAENAVLEATAQSLPRMGQMVPSGQITAGIGPSGGGASQVLAPLPSSLPNSVSAQQNMNVGMSNTSQLSTSLAQTVAPVQSAGQQQSVSGMQQVMPGQQRALGVQLPSTQPVVSTGQSLLTPQFGIQGSQPAHPIQQVTPQPAGATIGLQPNISPGQQPLISHKGQQPPHSNPGIPPTQATHLQQPSQGIQPEVVGVPSAPSTTHPIGGQSQQPPHSGTQPIAATSMQGVPLSAFGPQIPQQQSQPMIWKGTVDIMDQSRGQRPVKHPIQCTISAKREHISELHPDTWPQRMTLVAYPKQATSMIMTLMKLNQQQNMVRVVTFNFMEPTDRVYSLRLLMSNDQSQKHFGIVHFSSVQCTIKALLLVWNEKTMQFTGLIPMDQEKFVDVLKRVFRRQPQPGQQHLQVAAGNQQQGSILTNQQISIQQSGVSTMPGQQTVMSVAQANQPGTSADPAILPNMNPVASMNIGGIQSQPQHSQSQQQMLSSRTDKAAQMEKLLILLERSTPEQQQQLFQKMPQLTPDIQQSLLQRVQAIRLQKQQQLQHHHQQQQQQQQPQLHTMSQGSMMPGQLSEVMGQPGLSGGIGQQSHQQQQQSQLSRQAQQQGGMGVQMGMQRAQMQGQQQQQQQSGIDNTFPW